MPFANKLKALREAAGISQYALAKRAGISRQEISLLELNARDPSWATVQALAKALGVSCESFVEAAEPQPSEQASRTSSPEVVEVEGKKASQRRRPRKRS